MEKLAESRRGLAQLMNVPEPGLFGQLRQKESVSHLDLGFAALIDRASRGLDVFLPSSLRFDYPDRNPGAAPRLTRQTYYRLLSGERIDTTRLGRYLKPVDITTHRFAAGTLVLEHTALKSVPTVLGDVLKRVECLRQNRTRSLSYDPLSSLSDAMYGYYHAMPFTRGSAAIGRSFFAGLSQACFDVKLPATKVILTFSP